MSEPTLRVEATVHRVRDLVGPRSNNTQTYDVIAHNIEAMPSLPRHGIPAVEAGHYCEVRCGAGKLHTNNEPFETAETALAWGLAWLDDFLGPR